MNNILFITCWYPYPQKPWKSYFIKEHALTIKQQGFNIRVLHINVVEGSQLFKTEIFERLNELNETEIRITSRFDKKIYGLLPFLFPYIPGIKKVYRNLIRDFKPDLLHANVVFQAGVIARILRNKFSIRYIITEHLSGIPALIKNPLFKYFIKRSVKGAEKITTVSEFHKSQLLTLKEIYFQPQKFIVISNVVRPHTKTDVHIKYPANPDKYNFLMIANLTIKKHQPKRPDLVIKALAKLKDELKKPARLVLIGGGERVKYYENMCYENNIELVQTGFIPKEYVYEYYKQTDFLLHASEIETFSLVVAEALLFGIPCLASDNSALKERIKPFSGLLVDNSVDSWAYGIQKLVQTQWDREKIKNYYRNLYTPESVGKAFHNLYKSLEL